MSVTLELKTKNDSLDYGLNSVKCFMSYILLETTPFHHNFSSGTEISFRGDTFS